MVSPCSCCRRCSAGRRLTTTRRPAASLGYDLAQLLPYNLTRTWHLQLALFFVVASYLAGGHFPGAAHHGRRAARAARLLPIVLLAALVVVVAGSMAGEAASYKGWLHRGQAPSSALKVGSTSTSAGCGRSCWSAVWCCGASSSIAACAGSWRRKAAATCRYLFFYSAVSIPAVLRRRPGQPAADRLRHRRLLALLGRPSLGRGLPGAVHHDHGGLHVCFAGRGVGQARRRGSSIWMFCCTRSVASSARCIICTSAARRPFTWRSGLSSRLRR